MSIYNLSVRMLGSPADAEDATQEVFLKAFHRLDQYRIGEPFGAWLHGIARHHCIDVLRRRRPGPVPATTQGTEDIESAALAAIERERVRRALNQLPGRDRPLLVLRYWEDQRVESIARALRMSEGSVKVALMRARRAARAILESMEVTSNAM